MTLWFDYPITHGYYPNYDPNVPDTPHYAVDIATPLDTPITAIKAGKVVQADYAAWGGEVFVKPDDGSTEYYYYHFDQNNVSAGQHVNAGDVVGLSGGQNSGGSHPTAPQWSTGPHTHVGYFTSYTNTPIGTRPQGPNITPTIDYLRTGGAYSSTPTPTQQAATQQDATQVAQRALIRIAVFLVALVVIGGGAYLLFQKQINAGISKGKGLAEKAAVLMA